MASDYDDYMKQLLADLTADKTVEEIGAELEAAEESRRVAQSVRRLALPLRAVRELAVGMKLPTGSEMKIAKQGLAEFLDTTSDLDGNTLVVLTERGLEVLANDNAL